MEQTKKWITFLLCGCMIVGIGTASIIPAIARNECTCEVMVHGSNCPLSRCSCEGGGNGNHTEGCQLYGKAGELTDCICEPSLHAEGCPRFQHEGELLPPETSSVTDVETEAPSQPENASETTESGSTENSVPEEIPAESEEEMASSDELENPESAVPEQEQAASSQEPVPDSSLSEEKETAQHEESEKKADTDDRNAAESGEYPSNWVGYGIGKMRGNLRVAEEAFALEILLDQHINEICGMLSNGNNARITDTGDNLGDILAIYAVLTNQTEDYPYGVTFTGGGDLDTFYSVYWSMTQVTGLSNSNGAAISVNRLSVAEGAKLNGLNETQKRRAVALAEETDIVNSIVNKSIFAWLTDKEFETIRRQIPQGISEERHAVLSAALSLNGKVDYFWGGKSLAYGWDSRWGEMRTVTSKGSDTYGIGQPLGLDCSGFINWAFLNAIGKDAAISGSGEQWQVSSEIEWKEAQPGDIVFLHAPSGENDNHVGIVLTVDKDGPETVIHCSSGLGVAVTDADGFCHIRRPNIY